MALIMDRDRTATAYFTKIQDKYKLSIDVDGEGITSPPQGSHLYDPGTIVKITATPAPGWEFYKWGGDAIGDSASTNVTIDRDKNVIAHLHGLLELSSSASCATKWVGETCKSTVSLTYSATDLTNGKRPVTRVVVTLDGKQVADSGPIDKVKYENKLSLERICGKTYEFVITATNAAGRKFTGKTTITCPEE